MVGVWNHQEVSSSVCLAIDPTFSWGLLLDYQLDHLQMASPLA